MDAESAAARGRSWWRWLLIILVVLVPLVASGAYWVAWMAVRGSMQDWLELRGMGEPYELQLRKVHWRNWWEGVGPQAEAVVQAAGRPVGELVWEDGDRMRYSLLPDPQAP